MRLAFALVSLAACGGSKAASPPRAPTHVAEPAAPAARSVPAGWIAFEHDLWRGHVPSAPEISDLRDQTPGVRREVIAKGPLPEGMWLVGAYEFDPTVAASADPYVMIEASRDGLLHSTGMELDAEQRTSVASGDASCPAVRFRSHSADMGAAVTMFLCGARMVHVAWVATADLATASVDPAQVEARRDLLLANIHLRD
jgi:hypothetical protein